MHRSHIRTINGKFAFTWTGYGNDVIGHDRKLKNELPNTNSS